MKDISAAKDQASRSTENWSASLMLKILGVTHLQEACDLHLGNDALLHLLLLLQLVLKGAGQHIGEQLEGHRQQDLHEGHHNEDGKGHQPEDVCDRACQLPPLSPVQAAIFYEPHS